MERLVRRSQALSGVLLGLLRRKNLHSLVLQFLAFEVESLVNGPVEESEFNLVTLVSLSGSLNLALVSEDKALLQAMQKVGRKSPLQAT